MSAKYLELARQVLDQQVVDSEGVPCGKVDDIELDGTTKLKVTAILIGNGPASERLPELARRVSQKLFGKRTTRVPWNQITEVGDTIKLASTASRLHLDQRKGRVYRLIGKLPGAWKE